MSQSSSIGTVVATLRAMTGRVPAGGQLPSSRELVRRLGVSPVTVSRALAVLSADGTLVTRPGIGTFAAPPRVQATPRAENLSWQTIALGNNVIDDSGIRALAYARPNAGVALASGYPHTSLTAHRQVAAAMARAARRPGSWDAPPLDGLAPLRRWFAESIGPAIAPEDVVITSGGQAALSAAMRAIAPAGSPVLVESPTYLGALAVARAAGLRPVPIPMDHEGVRPEMLAEAFASTGARLLYCQPTFQNPTGAVMSAERRRAVLDVAAAAGAFVIEDDWARWLGHGAQPPAPMVHLDVDGRVIHIRSLTKTTAPSLRVGALVARGPVAERVRALRLVDDLFVSQPLQEAALDLVTSPAWQRHLTALVGAMRQRREVMLRAVHAHLPAAAVSGQPAGGFYTWVELPVGIDDVELAAIVARDGVHIAPGRPFFAAEPPGAFVRLSFVGPGHPGEIEEGVRRLGAHIVASLDR